MTHSRFHLAQANVATMRAALEDPIMEGFRSQLERINALADASPGFVWRLKTDAGNATDIRAYDDERILFNMSVWESIEALHAYVYRSDHAGPLASADSGSYRRRGRRSCCGGSLLVICRRSRRRSSASRGCSRKDRAPKRSRSARRILLRARRRSSFPTSTALCAPRPSERT
jgi:Domain of unknown function (DUF3291)